MANYAPSTRARIADLIVGMHVKTTDAILTLTHFHDTTQTELFNIVGRVGITQLFIELTAAADTNATQVVINATFTTPTITINPLCTKCTSIANLLAHQRIVVIGAVGSAASLTDGPGVTDVNMAGLAGNMIILGGETAAGVNTVGTIGMVGDDANQAGTITATGHVYYYPMSKGAYIEAAL